MNRSEESGSIPHDQVEHKEGLNPPPRIVDEVSDLLPLYSLDPVTPDAVVEYLEKHRSMFGRLGFGQKKDRESFPKDFTLYLTGRKLEERRVELEFLRSVMGEDLGEICSDAFEISQSVLPEYDYEMPSVVFLLNGRKTNARLMSQREVGINLNNVYSSATRSDTTQEAVQRSVEILKALIVHESNHTFINQLELPRSNQHWLYQIAFHEGLATLVETEHMRYHEDYLAEKELWFDIFRRVVEAEDGEVVDLSSAADSAAMQKYHPELVEEISSQEFVGGSEEFRSIVNKIFVESNGPAYHLGYEVWRRIKSDGGKEKVKEVVLRGVDEYVKHFPFA